MFAFDHLTGWTEIADFLRVPETNDCAEERRLAGFCPHPNLEVGDVGVDNFSVKVFNRAFNPKEVKVPEYEYLVQVLVGGEGQYVAVSKLPDLLELLRQSVPLSIAIDEWTLKRDRYFESAAPRSALRKVG